MNSFEAIISGIIQGLTEFLPVSSSGHLSLFQHFTGTAGKESAVFTVMLHLGTLAAVIIAFFPVLRKLFAALKNMISEIISRQFKINAAQSDEKMLIMLLVSLLPLFLSLLARRIFEYVSGDNDIIIEGICFTITSCLLFKAAKKEGNTKDKEDMTVRDAFIIGLMQALSPLPGISRSGSTISAAIMLGYKRQFSLDFSFIMGIPAVAAAILVEMPKIFLKDSSIAPAILALGLVAALITGIFSIVTVKKLVAGNKLMYFSYYTLILGLLVIIAGICEMLTNINFSALITLYA